MDAAAILAYCLGKPGAYEDLPFGPMPICVKVRGRIFAQVYPRPDRPMVTLKCTPAYGEAQRQAHPGVVLRGYHCPASQQPYWNTVYWQQGIGEDLLREMLDHAYETTVGKLSKKDRAALEQGGQPCP